MNKASVTNLDIAMERVGGFAQKFDRAHLDLACHAAFPQTLTPDLLYQIWLHFVPQAPWTAVARILLSRLCREVGYELYEMDVAVRNLLLTELKEDERFGKQQLDKLTEFCTHYLKQQFGSEEAQEEDLTKPQYWIAFAKMQPNQINRKLVEAINTRLEQKNSKELFRLASSIEAIPEALIEFEAPLLNLARGMLRYTTGDLEGAAEELNKLPRQEGRQVEIAGVILSIPDEIPLVKDAFIAFPNTSSSITYDPFPQQWAYMQKNLGIAYRERIQGEKAQNQEHAITAFPNNLFVFNPNAFPNNAPRLSPSLAS